MNHSRLRLLMALAVSCLTLLISLPLAHAEDVDPSPTIRKQAKRIEMMLRMGDDQRGNQELAQMIVMHKQHPTMLAVLGHFKRINREYKDAWKLLNQALTIDPDHAYANIEMANIELAHQQTTECFKRIDSMIKKHPDDPDVICMQATMLAGLKKHDAAEKLLLAYVGRHDSLELQAIALSKLAQVYEDQPAKKHDAAKAAFAALKASPTNPEYGSLAMEILGRTGEMTMALEAAKLLLVNVDHYDLPDHIKAKMKQMVQSQMDKLGGNQQVKPKVDLTTLADRYTADPTDEQKRKRLADAVIAFVADNQNFKRTALIPDCKFEYPVYWENDPTFSPDVQTAYNKLPKDWIMEKELKPLLLAEKWDQALEKIKIWEALYPSSQANIIKSFVLLRNNKLDQAQQAAAISLVMAAYRFAHKKFDHGKYLQPRGGTYFEALGFLQHITDLEAGKQPPMQKLVDQFYEGIHADDAIAVAQAYTEMDQYQSTNGYGWFMNDLVYDTSIHKWIGAQLYPLGRKALDDADTKSFEQYMKLMKKGRYVTYHIHTLDLLKASKQGQLKPNDNLFEAVFRQWGYEPVARKLKGELFEKQGLLHKALLEYNAGTGGELTEKIKPGLVDQLACAQARDRLEKQLGGKLFFIYSQPINTIVKLGQASNYPDNAALLASACEYLRQDNAHLSNLSLLRLQMTAYQNVEPKETFSWQAISLAESYKWLAKNDAATAYSVQGMAYSTLKQYENSGNAYVKYAEALTDPKDKAKGYHLALRSYRAGYLRDKATDAGTQCIATGGADLDARATYMWALSESAQFKQASEQAGIIAEGYSKLNKTSRAQYYTDMQKDYARKTQWATTQPANR